MRTAVVTALMALAFAGSAAAAPNVVLIVTDDQRWDTLAYMPTVQAELVGKGVTFSNAFAVNPLCCPSRASILTGTYSHTNGVWANGGRGYANFNEDSTLPVWLDSVGYQTMLIGKYLNGYWPPLAVETHVPPGWDHWFARWLHPQLYFDWQATNGETVFTFGSEPADYATDVNAAEAVRFIRESGPDPFFLYFAPKAPHVTNGGFSTDPAPRHVDAFAGLEPWLPPSLNEPDIADRPRHLRSLAPIPLESLTKMREEQLESLLAVDEAVAQMLAALEETGKLADTLIVFSRTTGRVGGSTAGRRSRSPTRSRSASRSSPDTTASAGRAASSRASRSTSIWLRRSRKPRASASRVWRGAACSRSWPAGRPAGAHRSYSSTSTVRARFRPTAASAARAGSTSSTRPARRSSTTSASTRTSFATRRRGTDGRPRSSATASAWHAPPAGLPTGSVPCRSARAPARPGLTGSAGHAGGTGSAPAAGATGSTSSAGAATSCAAAPASTAYVPTGATG